MIQIIDGNKVPLYKQVARRMMQRIRTGEYREGALLPPIRAISRQFGVSVTVVQQALRNLEQHGLVKARHGKGVLVIGSQAADRAALVFGMVHPYAQGMSFGRDVLHFATQAFGQRKNLLIPVSSEGDAAREREQVEHLVNNGVRGIILWPVPGDDNAAFLHEMAQRVPIVLVDRLVQGSSLPAVTHDTYRAGIEVCDHFFTRMKRKRILAVLDDLDISPYHDMLRGMQDQAQLLGRADDLASHQIPISQYAQQFNRADFSWADTLTAELHAMLCDGQYDAMFCYQEDILDYVVVQSGLIDRLPGLLLGATRSGDIHNRSRKYAQVSPVVWRIDHIKAIAAAADRLQEMVYLKRSSTEHLLLPLTSSQTSA